MNHISLVGRIGSEIESREFESGAKIFKFRMVVNRWDKKTEKDIPDWFFVQSFSKLCSYLEKGMMVGVNGKMITNTYTNDKNEKVTRYLVDANTVEIYAKKKEASETSQQPKEEGNSKTKADEDWEKMKQAEAGMNEEDFIDEEDIPFN